MSDEVQVTSTSWFSRLGSAIKGVFIGMFLVLASIVLLWWNEGRSVRRYKEISFAKENTVETPYDSIDASNENKLVHFAGKASTTDVLSEPTFGVTVKDSYRMSGKVEVYQWVEKVIPGKTETVKKLGGGTETKKYPDTYEYRKDWADSAINSDSFHEKVDKQTNEVRKNPYTTLPYAEVQNVVKAKSVKIGAHDLPADYIGRLGSSKTIELVADQLKLPENAIIEKNYIYLNPVAVTPATNAVPATPAAQTVATDSAAATTASATVETTVPQTAAVTASAVNPNAPKIGDVRIAFTHAPMDIVTVIAKQVGPSFETYKIDDDLSYIDVRSGDKEMTKEEVFKSNESAESMMVWFLRFLGFIIMASAFGMIFKPISVLADVVPLFGDIAESGIGIISALIAFVLSMFIIALAWLWYRPLIGILLLVLMGAAIFGIITLIAKARAAKNAKAAPAAEPAPEATPAA